MPAELEVFHGQQRIGHLLEDVGGEWGFSYAPDCLDAPPDAARFLSLKFPPQHGVYKGADVAALFRNLLPGGDIRRQLARKIGISQGNDFQLLSALGGDCPGAIRLAPPGRYDDRREVRPLTELDLRNVIAALPLQPLLIDVEGARLTLPGDHAKIPVQVHNDQIALTFGSALSSHIAKPAQADLRESIMNEGFCLALADELGLPVARSTVRHGAVTVLLVERFDRQLVDREWAPIHAEDFCQLMGVPPEQKYEQEGGLSVTDCVGCIKQYSVMPGADVRAFLRWLVFCFLIGNGTAHSKQLAIRHLDQGPRLAPFFGLLSTHVYAEQNHRLAMSIGGEDRPDWLLPRRWRGMAENIEVRGSYIVEVLRDLAERAPRASAAVAEKFQRECGFAAIIRTIRALIERRARQVIVSLEAEQL
mgnify:CR=1 FL=1|jgi:serine/threonine-protein kinase HipA